MTGWIRAEFARARQRAEELPQRARPVVSGADVWADVDYTPRPRKPRKCEKCGKDEILTHHCGTPIDGDDLKERLERASETLLAMQTEAYIQRNTDDRYLHLRAKREGVTLALSYLTEAIVKLGGGQND